MAEPMCFASLGSELKNRCGNCMRPYREHRPRMSAAPTCPKGGVYREATGEELEAEYRAEFGDGPPQPIATFDLSNSEDVARAKAALSPEALAGFFGLNGKGMAAFEAALRGDDHA